MANYPQFDDQVGVWKLKDVNDAVMGGYWRQANAGVGRAIVAGGFTPSYTNTISSFTMASSGNATDFGNLTDSRGEFGAMANLTRCIFAGGNSSTSPNAANIIDYVEIATAGNAADFGDLAAATYRSTGVGGNATRGVITEGNSDGDQLVYITPSSTGNAIDFGNRTISGTYVAGVTSPSRAVFSGAFTPSVSNIIDFVEIATTGNATDFGDLTSSRRDGGGCSSSTRGVYIGGLTPTKLTTLDFITIASQGNATDYGDLITAARGPAGVSNSVTGFALGGDTGSTVNTMSSFNISSGGTVTDFGDLAESSKNATSNSGSHGGLNEGYQGTRPTHSAGAGRGLLGGGKTNPAGTNQIGIQSIQIQTLGNTNDFGDLTIASYGRSGCASRTRGVFGGGYKDASPADEINVIESIEFASQGNAADFGDSTVARAFSGGNAGSQTRGIIGAGGNAPGLSNVIDYITIASAGNATDFGNLGAARSQFSGSGSPTRGVFFGGLE